MNYIKFLIIIFSLESLASCSFINYKSIGLGKQCTRDTVVWKEISPFFSPPNEFKNKFADLRSPLLFYNGDSVRNAKQWHQRRKEILNQWTEMMGEWPPFIKNQKLTKIDSQKIGEIVQYTVRFRWLPNEYTYGYLLIPKMAKQRVTPAVITVYYEPETAIGKGKLSDRDYALQLAKRGFVTLSVGSRKTTENKTYSLYYPAFENAKVQPLSTLAYAAANAYYALSEVPQVDPMKVGIMGHSYGGKWAMFASCLFDKFAAAVWSDPGIVFDETKGGLVNYWEPWYLGYYPPPWAMPRREVEIVEGAKGLYPWLVNHGYDLHELHALMAPRPFLVSGGESDQVSRWEILNYSIQVNELLGYQNGVAMTNREGHSPTPESNDQAYAFLEYFLK